MRTKPRLIAIILAAVASLSAHAKSESKYTTIIIDYVGKSDRPIFPIIISSSDEEANWYKHKLFSDPIPIFAHVYIIQKSTLKEISDVPLLNGNLNRPSSNGSSRTSPILRLALAVGHHSKEVTVEAEESVTLLDEIKKRVPEYPSLAEQLAEFEGRMKQYLSNRIDK